ncbi:MAG: cobalamin-independent methionine synthase II family protein [Nitrospinota bacterium]|jgi:5-methyltetrahydropteroyltriglutamate--homocysteine methyltransferase|nr:cobalamin-independent methionine synthase II family protein [Nitrospinota bacterium]
MMEINEGYRADVIGSLLRPDYLKEAQGRFEAGEITHAEFKEIEDRAVDEAVALQTDAGLDVITDGEMRRYAFFGNWVDAVEGFDKWGGEALTYRNEEGETHTFGRPVVVSRLKRRRHMCAEEFAYLRARTGGGGGGGESCVLVKATLINAQQAASYYEPEKSQAAYPSLDAYMADVVDILRGEVEELLRLGCRLIQVDAPQYTGLLDPEVREMHRRRGNDPDRLLDACIERDNAVIEGFSGATFAMHLCRGNNQSKFYAAGGYEPIAAKIFQKTRFGRFLLEYDDGRSGGFEPLDLVPDDRTVVLGLLSTKTGALESREELKERIREAERFVPLERLALSTQCGFASTMEGNLITPAEQEAKLRMVAETAKEVWG